MLRDNKNKLLITLALLLAIGGGLIVLNETKAPWHSKNVNTNNITSEQPRENIEAEPQSTKPKYDTTSPSSITFIANKNLTLPDHYVPEDLIVPDVRLRLSPSEEQMKFRNIAAEELKNMFDAAAKDNITLVFGSGYRSYTLQKQFYDGYVVRDGVAVADRYSARPGTSEHQTGLAFDVTSPYGQCHLEICFEDLAEGKWMAANAHRFGFILRYPNDKESITGYQYEPWHFRFVGRELATEIYERKTTLEEFFKLAN